MGPNLTNLHKVMDRIAEISRKYGVPRTPLSNAKQNNPIQNNAARKSRFVELLDAEAEKQANRAMPGRRTSLAMDELRQAVSRVSENYNIDEELIRAVIQVESGWKSDAVSSKGAQGLMQLMPRTAEMLGVNDSFNPEENIEGGVKYLAQLTDKYDGDVELALAAYNAGPARVDAVRRAPFPETARYVNNVMALYHRYREED